MNCTAHNLIPAKLQCAECGRFLCEQCVRAIEVERTKVYVCAHCGGRTITPTSVVQETEAASQKQFWGELAGLLGYPLKGSGLVTMIVGTIFFVVMSVATAFPLIGIIIAIIVAGYLLKFYTAVVQQSAKGYKTPPYWGEIEFLNLRDLVCTFFRTVFVAVFSFCAPLIYLWHTRQFDEVFYALIGLSVFYFPMAFLAVAYYESIEALNPIPVFRSMGRALGHYIVVVVLFYVLLGLDWGLYIALGLAKVTRGGLGESFMLVVVHRFLSLYLFTALMHLLGVFLYCNKRRLNWQ